MSDFHSEHTIKNFERSVKLLQDNLQYLANNDKVSDKFLSIQNEVIKHIITYYQIAEKAISTLQMDLDEMRLTKSQESQKLHDRVVAFEALCIIHGILDFPMWIGMGKQALIKDAIDFNKEDVTQLPIHFREKIESRPTEERDEINRLLNLEWERKIEKDLNKIKERVNANRSQRDKEKEGRRREEAHNSGNQGVLGFEI